VIVEDLLVLSTVCCALSVSLNIIGVSIYDIRTSRRNSLTQKKPRSIQPVVSIILPVKNNELTVTDCLDSLNRGSYKKLQIIIADNASTDNTKKLIRRYIKVHPKKNIKLYQKRQPSSELELISKAFKIHAEGSIIMVLDPCCAVEKTALRKAVNYFNLEPETDRLLLNNTLAPSMTLHGLLQDYGSFLGNRINKTNSTLNFLKMADYRNNQLYKKDSFQQLINKRVNIKRSKPVGGREAKYLSDAMIYKHPLKIRNFIHATNSLHNSTFRLNYAGSTTYFKAVNIIVNVINNLSVLSIPFLLLYFTYLAVSLKQPVFLLSCWSALYLFMIFTIMENEGLNWNQKLKYIILLPVSYVSVYAVTLRRYIQILLETYTFISKRKI
jgi:biofilm PGA synthesis N-glycosyltransferase PgaC